MAPRPKIHVTFTQGRTVFRGLRRLRSERPSELTHLHKYLSGRPTNWVKDSIPHVTFTAFALLLSPLLLYDVHAMFVHGTQLRVSTFGFVLLRSRSHSLGDFFCLRGSAILNNSEVRTALATHSYSRPLCFWLPRPPRLISI